MENPADPPSRRVRRQPLARSLPALSGELIAALALAGVALVSGSLTAYFAVADAAFHAQSTTVAGIVVASESLGAKEAPIVEFTPQGGETVRRRLGYFASPPSHRVGDSVTVRYLREDPSSANIDGESGYWLGTLIAGLFFGVSTLLCCVFGIMSWTHARHARRSARAPG